MTREQHAESFAAALGPHGDGWRFHVSDNGEVSDLIACLTRDFMITNAAPFSAQGNRIWQRKRTIVKVLKRRRRCDLYFIL